MQECALSASDDIRLGQTSQAALPSHRQSANLLDKGLRGVGSIPNGSGLLWLNTMVTEGGSSTATFMLSFWTVSCGLAGDGIFGT